MPEKDPESELVNRLTHGDPVAFSEIFEKYFRKVYAFALRSFRNQEDAEGAVQEVFYQLWKDRSKLKELRDIEAWIFRICIFYIRNHYRKLAVERKYLKHFAETYLEGDYSTVADLEYKDLLEKIGRIIEQLPTRQKEIFNLSKKDAMSNLQISEKLEISVRTVENHLSSAKSFIRKALSEDNILVLLFFALFVD